MHHIDPERFSKITLLTRRKIQLPSHLANLGTVQQISGSIDDSAHYAAFLGPDTRVLHLAGLTGKAERKAYFETNTRSTERLIHAAERAGVHAFLLISSIAVSFKDRAGYHYAESKQLAEHKLQASRLRYCIVRPTMILGVASPVLANLSSLAKGPVILQPGNGKIPIQPIDVDDLAGLLLAIIEEDAFGNNVLELGGPEIISMGEFLQKIHAACHQQRGVVIRLPLGLIIWSLRILERIIGRYLPVTSGQFASFRNPGTIEPDPWFNGHAGKLRNVDSMLSHLVAARTGAPQDTLAAECSVYTRYLAGQEPDAYIQRKYAEAFEPGRPLAIRARSRFESMIEKLSAKNPIYTRAVDGYCKFFFREAMVRKKVVLLLAILECRAETAGKIDHADQLAAPLMLVTFLTQITRSILLLIVATLLLSPVRLALNALERLSETRHG
ncbi:MAG: NAD(P)H-binding protein [Methylococcaceae bacterium]|nr:NAD(P)H-binding protein [Methylococcaceae bacterium]